VQVDIPKARELLADAAQKGYGRALFLLAALESETSRDAKLVLRYLNEGAKAGDPRAWFGLARLYRDGEFAPKDLAESFRLMRTAADWGMGEALAEIAEYYYNGWGTPRDPAKARDCCIASAELACPAGEAIYADILLSGRYEGSFDAVNGMHWMRCAAEDGDGRSQYFMAIAYLTGASVPRDEAVGRQWLERSAKEDPAAAAFLRLLNAPKIEPRVGETNPSPPLKDEPTSRP
jgi:localization factor PodJL